MEFQEAKNLNIGDAVFVINNNGDEVYPKKVTGVNIKSGRTVDVTFIDHVKKTALGGYVLSHEEVFLKEEFALDAILSKYLFQRGGLDLKIIDIRTRITKLKENSI